MPKKADKIVFKVLPGMDLTEILATTYQMRSVYAQLGTGFFSSLDVMNYIQHHAACLMAKKGDVVLDVCCGRAQMLPLLRWYRKEIACYVGVDISLTNMGEAQRKSALRDISELRFDVNDTKEGDPYYPFAVEFVESNVAEMAFMLEGLELAPFDYIIYTASIEHMQKEAGAQSLVECFKVLKSGGTLFLSSPNTADKQDPYDTQYAAHLYEWDTDELLKASLTVGFELVDTFGLVAKVKNYRKNLVIRHPDLVPIFDRFAEYMPSAWLYGTFPILTPDIADETVIILRKP
jgi:ubiquinone/menaquinone biosynthesis C-methylase UbiE